MTTLQAQHLSLAGIPIDALELSDLIALLGEAIFSNDKMLVFHQNLHSIYLYETYKAFRDSYNVASCVYVDGLPVIWLGRMLGLPLANRHRITFLESFDVILQHASQRGWRVFYLGSSHDVVSTAIPLLREKHPQLVISAHNGYFSKNSESQSVITQINDFGADIVFVGMGMPKQELWLAEYHTQLIAPVIVTSGATLDYVAGHAYRPPKWAGRFGLYGAFRLASNPARFWRRYLVEPVILAWHLARRIERDRISIDTIQ